MNLETGLSYVSQMFSFKIKVEVWFIIGIVALLSIIKNKIDKKHFFKSEHYFIAAAVLGIFLGIVAIPGPIEFRTAVSYSFAHAIGAMGLYAFQKRLLPGEENIFGWGKKGGKS